MKPEHCLILIDEDSNDQLTLVSQNTGDRVPAHGLLRLDTDESIVGPDGQYKDEPSRASIVLCREDLVHLRDALDEMISSMEDA